MVAVVLLPGTLALAACTSGRSTPTPAVSPATGRDERVDESASRFPPIPLASGPLALRVVYPPNGAVIAARDSTFIFGSTGSGSARLTINGAAVDVERNGSWLAFLPLPPRDRAVYDIVAVQGGDTARLQHRIAFPAARPVLGATGPLAVDSASVAPRGAQSRLADDWVRVSLRAPRNAAVTVVASDGGVAPLRNLADIGAPFGGDSALWATDVRARMLDGGARIVVTRGRDSVVVPAPRITIADSRARRFGVLGGLGATAPAPNDSDRVVIARPVAGGTYKWFLLPGTVVELTGRFGDVWRARLDAELDVFVDAAEVRDLPAGAPAPARIAGNARVVARGEWSDVIIPMAERPAYAVEETGNGLVLTLYSTVANSDIINYATDDAVVRRVTWEQVARDRARYTIDLAAPVYGYVVRWERGAFVLRVRRAPAVDPERPLAGLTIAVDPGHPPAGSTGPTGFYEGVATLEISNRLKPLLEARGATVLMTRTTDAAVALGDRPVIARRANAHAFVSIHLNALPDGVNPFTAHGTGTYYFNARSEPLARAVQRGMVRRMALRDLGIYYDNLAVLRPTWMPSILCEGAFIMMPRQEALLRMPEFQAAYALGVAEGLESYFSDLSARATAR